MTDVRTLRRGEAVALSALSPSRRSPEDLVVSVHGDGPAPDVVAFLLGAGGAVGTDRDFVFFNQPASPDGAVDVEPAAARAHIRTSRVEERVSRILVACAGDAFEGDRPSSLRVDIAQAGVGVLATAVVDVPAAHRAETVLEVYRWGTGWRLRLLGEGYTTGLAGLARDHGVQVDDGQAPPVPQRCRTPPHTPPRPRAAVAVRGRSPVRAPRPW